MKTLEKERSSWFFNGSLTVLRELILDLEMAYKTHGRK